MVNNTFQSFRLNKAIFVLGLMQILTFVGLSGQEATDNFFFRVYFRDKGENYINNYNLSDLVSQRAIERRGRSGVTEPDYRDIPVYRRYISQILSMGYKLHCTSKWVNTAVFSTATPPDISKLMALPFITDVKTVKNNNNKSQSSDKLRLITGPSDQSSFDRPLSMLNGIALQNSGFRGNGILVAILDAGFANADNIQSLDALRNRNGIEGSYDFVENKKFVYDYHNHGTAVLSILAGEVPEALKGSAPDADYLLLRTEDSATEFPVEEDFWTAGAEFADSLGADIISSSLGYYTFDDPSLNYKYSDLDGNSTMITKAADIAAAKGILVVCSAGNERDNSWIHIIAPSDGDSVLSVGAVDGEENIASFSSAGPSYDRRIKPDVVAQGVSVPVQIESTTVEKMNGTSFSCPVISGMCACIMQAVPEATNYDIISAFKSCSDMYLFPDSLYGYGIPDITGIIDHLQKKFIVNFGNESVASPNPCKDELTITFRNNPGRLIIEIFGATGKMIFKKQYNNYISRAVKIEDFRDFRQGFYFVRLSTSAGTFTHKIIKIS